MVFRVSIEKPRRELVSGVGPIIARQDQRAEQTGLRVTLPILPCSTLRVTLSKKLFENCVGVRKMTGKLNIRVNERAYDVAAAPDTPLLYVLSNELLLQGPRF